MANDPKTTNGLKEEGDFLGSMKFNQAGYNAPMPGEVTAEATNNPGPFGGPRVWIGTVIVLILLGVIWLIYGNGPAGLHKNQGRGGGISIDQKPSIDPDAPSSEPQ